MALDCADAVQEAALLTREIMVLEGKLIALALENITYGSFDADWAAHSIEKNKEIVLEGLYRGACAAPRDDSRSSCPEMTISGLVGDGKYNLINLLKRLIAHDPTGNGRVKEIFIFSRPYVDHETQHTEEAPDALKNFLYCAVLFRHYYILETLFAWSPGQRDEPPQKQHYTKQSKTQARRFMTKHGLKVDNSQCKEEAAVTTYACYFCHEKTDDLLSFVRDPPFKMLNYHEHRSHRAECQRADWKIHKRYCGKCHFDPKILAPEVDEPGFIGYPVAVPGFNRSPALWLQIGCLDERDSRAREYHFMPDMNVNHARSIRILCPRARLYFLVARRHALASGSLPAIYKMFEIIRSQIEYCNLMIEQVQRHFEREYRMKMDLTPAAIRAVVKDFEEPTKQELEEERLFDAQREASVGRSRA
ncbi:hypothetical protein K438DRAFT_1965485 [Mycena galopus ATCC 62051]|nr:hypothetical protein K438DRAFT_1965485 [Mycena galopus ATCC 62051]